MKRDNWTNEEVMYILEGLKLVGKDGKDINEDWNTGLDIAISQFYDFKKDVKEFAAMAYDPENKEIVVVGPKLPR